MCSFTRSEVFPFFFISLNSETLPLTCFLGVSFQNFISVICSVDCVSFDNQSGVSKKTKRETFRFKEYQRRYWKDDPAPVTTVSRVRINVQENSIKNIDEPLPTVLYALKTFILVLDTCVSSVSLSYGCRGARVCYRHNTPLRVCLLRNLNTLPDSFGEFCEPPTPLLGNSVSSVLNVYP